MGCVQALTLWLRQLLISFHVTFKCFCVVIVIKWSHLMLWKYGQSLRIQKQCNYNNMNPCIKCQTIKCRKWKLCSLNVTLDFSSPFSILFGHSSTNRFIYIILNPASVVECSKNRIIVYPNGMAVLVNGWGFKTAIYLRFIHLGVISLSVMLIQTQWCWWGSNYVLRIICIGKLGTIWWHFIATQVVGR